jgi:DNA (cytosine-5)-methyltransferase 1
MAKGDSPFRNAGVMVDGKVWTADVRPIALQAAASAGTAPRTLGDVVARTGAVDESFYLDEADLARWQYLKGAKREPRVTAEGFAYNYTEGALAFPDALDRPARTVITGEGGSGASRTRHVVRAADGRLRRLTPEELEELNGFPRGFTQLAGISDVKRAFLMGNALVVGLVQSMGKALHAVIDASEQVGA